MSKEQIPEISKEEGRSQSAEMFGARLLSQECLGEFDAGSFSKIGYHIKIVSVFFHGDIDLKDAR